MEVEVRSVIGLLTGVLVLAGLSVAIINGGQTAAILGTFANGFTGMVNAATHPGQAGK